MPPYLQHLSDFVVASLRRIWSITGRPELQPIECPTKDEQAVPNRRRIENATFGNGSPSALNACVGENGSPDAIDYARGYASAATLLLDMVITDWDRECSRNFHPDEFVYPICFNMRHAVELHLKEAATTLINLSEHRRPLVDIDLKTTHDLFKLWTFLKESAPFIDRRLPPMLTSMDAYIVDIADIDATGQVFRYPYDTEFKKHLVEVSIINMVKLRERFGQLKELMEKLFRLNEELRREYRLGTFTKSLSRHDLSIIAERLPERECWGDSTFKGIRAQIRLDYSLGSRECSDAFNLIQRNYQFSAKIGIEFPMAYLREQDLFAFLDAWCTQHDLAQYKAALSPLAKIDYEPTEWDFDEVLDSRKKLSVAIDGLLEVLTIQTLSEIDALYYYARETRYSEEFIEIRAQYLRKYKVNMNSFPNGISHILEKTNAMSNLLQSLNSLGQYTLVSKIAGRYGLEEHLQYIFKGR